VIDSGKSRVEVIEGDSVVIACPAMDAVPPPEIQWLKVTVFVIHCLVVLGWLWLTL